MTRRDADREAAAGQSSALGPSAIGTEAVREAVLRAIPGARVVSIQHMKPDEQTDESSLKSAGYGEPLLVTLERSGGTEEHLVFHTASANQFGHQHRADRAAEMLLAFDTFKSVPRQVPAIDVGAVKSDGAHLVSLRDTTEFYLLTGYAPGHVYAEELREVGHRGGVESSDLEHCDALVDYLTELHANRGSERQLYRRSVRDLVGSGEGIFGIIDGYPEGIDSKLAERLPRLDSKCQSWRWKLRGYEHRAVRSHGDFHPFNVIFSDESELAVLDASRGCLGDAADDVTCMAINYVFFALVEPGTWQAGYAELWRRFWQRYLEQTGDSELLDVAAPYLAWRGLVVSNPTWYPHVPDEVRHALLGFVERALDSARFDPSSAEALFT